MSRVIILIRKDKKTRVVFFFIEKLKLEQKIDLEWERCTSFIFKKSFTLNSKCNRKLQLQRMCGVEDF